ncbi:MAG: gamma-glutamyltransferase [Halieaceae bacterium]|nr:gamma-glutamyltransferase [Halieaceae bacterium]
MVQLRVSLLLLLALLTAPACWAGSAAVALPDRHAAEAAQLMLESGGNAMDAAIAAAFVLAVTYPEAGNIGGGGFMLSYMGQEAAFLDFRESAPKTAHRDMYLDEGGNFIQHKSLIGGQASGVPGTVSGLHSAHLRYASKPWKTLLQPAIGLARDGFAVPAALARHAKERSAEIGNKTNFANYFGGLRTGEIFRQLQLAATLERIAHDPDDFYHGKIARQITAQMVKTNGLITLADMAAYKAVWRNPIQAQWRGYTILSAPPPSSGGVALIQLLQMRDFADVHFKDLWHNSPRYIHLLAEIEKRVFADRAQYLADPDFVEVPIAELLDMNYLAARATQINPTQISPAIAVPPGLESTDTTHLSILDSKGNAVSLTYTLNWDFGSGVVVEGAGFLLNNEMDDFSAKVGVPNKFGVIGNARNAIAPGKRMLSSMTPTIFLHKNKPALVIGTPGGSTIFTSVMQVILNLYDFSMPLQAAVDATRFHHQLPDATLIRHDRREITSTTRTKLQAMGYIVEPNSWGNLGDIQVIRIEGEKVQAAADSRNRGVARLIP